MAKLLILSAGRKGDLLQMQHVADALGWPWSTYELGFAAGSNAAIALRPMHYLQRGRVADIVAHEADIVLCAEASAGAIAVHAKSRGGRFKLVCIGRPRGHFSAFDLIITSPQYQLQPASNVVEFPVGPHYLPALTERDQRLISNLKKGGKPTLAVLVGGTSLPDVFDERAAMHLADIIKGQVGAWDVHVVTSPRTGESAARALQAVLFQHATIHLWSAEQGTAYPALVAAADSFVVTSDSVSMTAEAMLTGKPVWLHRLPKREKLTHVCVRWLRRWRFADFMFERGLLEVRPNRERLYNHWHEQYGLGLDSLGVGSRDFPQTAPLAAERIRHLFSVNSR